MTTGIKTALGMGGYFGSPAQAEDRRDGIRQGAQVWWNTTPPLLGTIEHIRQDDDGDPWFSLSFSDHKDVWAQRDEILPFPALLRKQAE